MSYQHKGQMRNAEATMREAVALPPTTDYLEFNQKLLAVFLLGRQRQDEALAEAGRLQQGRWPATRAVGHALSGHALLGLGRKDEAREALAGAERELAGVAVLTTGISIGRGMVQPWVDGLRGELLLREGSSAEGSRVLEKVAQSIRAIPGPDAWINALFRLEAMARLARERGQWELAEHMARQMLDHDPAYGGSHLALAKVAEQRGEQAAAAGARAEAARYWRDADPELPELAASRDGARTHP
jgi:tetratricopeptide (TPR) repeat protein